MSVEEVIFFHRYHPKPGDVVVELGAASGYETHLMHKMVGPEGFIIAVEPEPHQWRTLYDSFRDISNVVTLHLAVSDTRGYRKMSAAGTNTHFNEGGDFTAWVTRLDDITSELDQIDFLKVNIEGAEDEVFWSSQETLAKTRNVVVSCHDFLHRPTQKSVRHDLELSGFTVSTHDDPLVIPDAHNGACIGGYLYGSR